MAQVPYDPVPTVPSEAQPIRRPEVPEIGAAFGVNIAQAEQKLGGTGEQVGNEIFSRAIWLQQLNNETNARDVSIAATQQMAKDYEQFRANTTGSPEELDAFLKGLNATRLRFRAGLNPMAAKMFDAEAASLQNRFTMASAAQNIDAFKTRANQSAASKVDIAKRSWVNLDDENEAQAKGNEIDRALDVQAATAVPPWTEDRLADEKLKQHEQLWASRIALKGETDVNGGFALLNRAMTAGEISDPMYVKLQDELWRKNRDQTGTQLAESVYAPAKSQVQMENEVKKKAKDFAHGDPDFEKAAVQAVVTKYTQEHTAIIHDQWQGKNDADTAINSGKYRNVQEFMADPTNADAVSRAGPEYDPATKIQTYWRSRDAQTSAAIKNKLLGEAHDDPQKFLGEDLWQDGLSNADRGVLMLRKKQLLAGGQPDPSVTKAAEAITNIFPNSVPQKGTDGYRMFLGSLQGALDDYEAEAQRKLTRDDYEKIGKSILSMQPGTGWFHTGVGAVRVFEAPVPPDVLDHYRTQGMDDDQIAYNYHRALAISTFRNLFGGVSSAPKK